MASQRQKTAARRNIKKAQRKWKGMSSRAHALAQPKGRKRAKPGAKGSGQYFHIEVRPRRQFISFRT